MDDQVLKLAGETLGRYEALTKELSDPNIYNDQRHYAEVAKEHSRMRRGAEMSRELLDAVEAEQEARELVPQAGGADTREADGGGRVAPPQEGGRGDGRGVAGGGRGRAGGAGARPTGGGRGN